MTSIRGRLDAVANVNEELTRLHVRCGKCSSICKGMAVKRDLKRPVEPLIGVISPHSHKKIQLYGLLLDERHGFLVSTRAERFSIDAAGWDVIRLWKFLQFFPHTLTV